MHASEHVDECRFEHVRQHDATDADGDYLECDDHNIWNVFHWDENNYGHGSNNYIKYIKRNKPEQNWYTHISSLVLISLSESPEPR